MTVQVELFRPDDHIGSTSVELAPLLREVFEPILQRPLDNSAFLLRLIAMGDSELLPGRPSLVNLRGSHGWAQVSIVEDGLLIYQHPHTVREIVAEPLQRRLRLAHPDVSHWGFGLVGPGLEQLAMVRPTPTVAGEVEIPAGSRRRRAKHIEELPDPEPAALTLAELHVADPHQPFGGPIDDLDAEPVAVVLSMAAYQMIVETDFSPEVEEGGFVIGHRYADREYPGRHLLDVTAIVQAQSTGASLLRFTFTGESFLRLGDLLAARASGEQILGWYHTHLFAATDSFGLSTIDVQLHTSTFRRTWQVAALLNLDEDSRVLRFYRSDGDHLAETPVWLADAVTAADKPVATDRQSAVVNEQ